MSISRTLVILALAAAPATLMAQPSAVMAGDAPFTFRLTAAKDTLWTIVAETVPLGPQVSVNQAMVAILRQNPNAFVRGNLHMLRKGVALTIPSLAQIKAENRIKSGAVIEQHMRLLVEGVREQAPLYELKLLPVASAASAPARPASAASPAPATSRPSAASAPASAVTPRPVAPAASAAASAAAPAASAVAPASAAASAPAVRASQPTVPASAAVQPAVPVASEPAPAVPAAPGGGAAYLTYLAAGAALLGVALWAWRRRAGSSVVADPTADLTESSGPRLVQVSTAAVDTARSVDAMKPVLELVRNESVAPPPPPQDAAGQATLNLQVARAYVELRRFDEAYVLLQYVAQHGSPDEQQEAQVLLRGSS